MKKMTREDIDFIGAMNMCDEISNEAYRKIMIHCEEEQPCEDTISRQAAIDAIENEQKKIMRSDWAIDQAKFSAMSEIRALIADLPCVSTKKTGRWIENNDDHYDWYECSECGYGAEGEITTESGVRFNYCPHCGAKMGVEE